MKNFKVIILMGVLVVLMLLILLVKAFFTSSNKQPSASPLPALSPIPSTQPFSNTISPAQTGRAVSPDALVKDVERIKSKKELSATDLAVRKKMLDSLSNKSGILNETSDFRADYTKAADEFMVEILSQNFDAAKKGAVEWFRLQGLSNEGICNLPVVFYLSPQSDLFLRGSNLQFNPVPEECGK